MNLFHYDFGYAWPWAFGHLIAAAVFGAAAMTAWRVRASLWMPVVTGALALWALGGAAVVHGALRFNLPLELPTAAFLPGGSGRVLDGGAGSGRATLMVLLARPHATVTALDIFSDGYGIDGNTPARLRDNAARAGVADRLDVVAGDLRAMPLDGEGTQPATLYVLSHTP
jgi:SAM-dependent methyltransferase